MRDNVECAPGTLPQELRSEEIFDAAVAQKVAFVPGAPFFANEEPHHFLRLNFSNRPPEVIEDGIRRLGEVLIGAVTGQGKTQVAVASCSAGFPSRAPDPPSESPPRVARETAR